MGYICTCVHKYIFELPNQGNFFFHFFHFFLILENWVNFSQDISKISQIYTNFFPNFNV